MSFDAPEMPKLGDAPPPAPMFGQLPAGPKKKKPQSQAQPTFLGTEQIAQAPQMGMKTLLGQ